MIVHEVFAHIVDGEVKNILVCDNYPTADYIAKCIYDKEAYAVDCLQYRCAIGDKYHDSAFWRVDAETGEETQIPYEPTQEQEVVVLKQENEELKTGNDELMLAMAELIGGEAA